MTSHAKVVIVLLLVGLLVIIGARYALPLLQDTLQRQTSDAQTTRGTLSLGVDNWVGYLPLCSQPMVANMRRSGYVFSCENDNADIQKRFERLQSGDLDFAVATVDSYLTLGSKFDFPGTVVAVIDESSGGDAILARRDRAGNLDDLKGLEDFKVAYTPASPSEHLLRAVGTDFDIRVFRERRWNERVETNGSTEARKRLLDGEVSVAALWEPDVSLALADPAIVKLIGSEDTGGLIVDVLLVNRRFSQDNPEAVEALLESFFQVQRLYRDNPRQLRDDVMSATGLNATQVEAMLRGVAWATLTDNALVWFGASPAANYSEERLVESINSAVRILLESGDLKVNPLPDRDPYRITNRQFVAGLYAGLATTDTAGRQGTRFTPLDERSWARLREVGTLKVRPIGFKSGTGDLSFDGRQEIDVAAERLKNYPNFRILVKGHTGLRGDPQANLKLSKERAGAVANYLISNYGIDPNRILSIGYGSSRPLPQAPGESDRAYGYRLPRVELALVAESY